MEDIKLKEIIESIDILQKALVYLLFSKSNEPVKGRTLLQKEMFLVANYIEEVKENADFVPYNHGAYSEYVDISLNQLISYNLIREEGGNIHLTSFGEKLARAINREFKDEEKKAILEFKELINNMTLDEALAFSYFSFPEFAKESAILNKIKNNRISLAYSLYKKGLVNGEKALFISGLDAKEFFKRYTHD